MDISLINGDCLNNQQNHHAWMLKNLSSIKEHENLTDLTFICSDGIRFGHRRVFSLVSSLIKPATHPSVPRMSVTLQDISTDVLDTLMALVYKGTISANRKEINGVNELCKMLSIPLETDSIGNFTDEAHLLDEPPEPSRVPDERMNPGLNLIQKNVQLYCICRAPEKGRMIGCDFCDEWFHAKCIGLTKEEIKDLKGKVWKCPHCVKTSPPEIHTKNQTGKSRNLDDLRSPKKLKIHLLDVDKHKIDGWFKSQSQLWLREVSPMDEEPTNIQAKIGNDLQKEIPGKTRKVGPKSQMKAKAKQPTNRQSRRSFTPILTTREKTRSPSSPSRASSKASSSSSRRSIKVTPNRSSRNNTRSRSSSSSKSSSSSSSSLSTLTILSRATNASLTKTKLINMKRQEEQEKKSLMSKMGNDSQKEIPGKKRKVGPKSKTQIQSTGKKTRSRSKSSSRSSSRSSSSSLSIKSGESRATKTSLAKTKTTNLKKQTGKQKKLLIPKISDDSQKEMPGKKRKIGPKSQMQKVQNGRQKKGRRPYKRKRK